EHFIGHALRVRGVNGHCRQRGRYPGYGPVNAGTSARRGEPAGIARHQRRPPCPPTGRKPPRADIHVSRSGLEKAKKIGRGLVRDIVATNSRENSLPTVLTPMGGPSA